jgi:SAM-dependent methyltransferase
MKGMAERSASDWEDRARSFGTDPRAVLFKSFSPALNRYLHDWHAAELERVIDGLAGAATLCVLDVGCGYGRLSREVRRAAPRARLVGLDVSATFAGLYARETGGEPVVSDLDGLPLQAGRFDLILLVTTLMYLHPRARQRLVTECLAALAPEGRMLIIENSRHGRWIYSGFGLIPLLARVAGWLDTSVETGGHAFTYPEIERLVDQAGGEVVRRTGVVAFTFLVPVMLVLARIGGEAFNQRLLRRCRPSIGVKKYSLHICYEVRRAGRSGESRRA